MSELTTSSINERAAEEYFKKGLEAENSALHEKAVEFYERFRQAGVIIGEDLVYLCARI